MLLNVAGVIPGLDGICRQAKRLIDVTKKVNSSVKDVLEMTNQVVEVMEYMQRLAEVATHFTKATQKAVEKKLGELQELLNQAEQAIGEYKSKKWMLSKIHAAVKVGDVLAQLCGNLLHFI